MSLREWTDKVFGKGRTEESEELKEVKTRQDTIEREKQIAIIRLRNLETKVKLYEDMGRH